MQSSFGHCALQNRVERRAASLPEDARSGSLYRMVELDQGHSRKLGTIFYTPPVRNGE
jgi:hypothetical protein